MCEGRRCCQLGGDADKEPYDCSVVCSTALFAHVLLKHFDGVKIFVTNAGAIA